MTCFEKNSCEKCGIPKKASDNFLLRWDGIMFCNKCAKEENIPTNKKQNTPQDDLSKILEMLGLKDAP
jgi:uncharacterized Zn finger protein (UPF0148 family)